MYSERNTGWPRHLLSSVRPQRCGAGRRQRRWQPPRHHYHSLATPGPAGLRGCPRYHAASSSRALLPSLQNNLHNKNLLKITNNQTWRRRSLTDDATHPEPGVAAGLYDDGVTGWEWLRRRLRQLRYGLYSPGIVLGGRGLRAWQRRWCEWQG